MDNGVESVCKAISDEALYLLGYEQKIKAISHTEATSGIRREFIGYQCAGIERMQELVLKLTNLFIEPEGLPPDNADKEAGQT